jgi:predicted metalloprotease with PDZ domain
MLHAQLDWVADHPATIVYRLDMRDVQQHELHISVEFPAVPEGIFYVKMPQSSPGRYARHNFAKNVYDVRVTEGRRRAGAVRVDRIDPNTWAVSGHRGRVTFQYTLFADGGDGTYSGIDDRKLHLNMPATFVYSDQLNDRPVMIELAADQRPEWQVATQLVRVGDRTFAAPDYAYFFDSPTLVGEMMRDQFTVTSGKRTDTIELVVMHDGSRETFEHYLGMVERVVREQRTIYGELPPFDYGRYTFLCAYNDYIGGDGMEHRNSTICSAPIPLGGNEDRLIGTVSHEFFHAWNVERIRPASLEPFAFDHVNMSGELWFAEGFTSYYDDLALTRAGLMTPQEYIEGLAGGLNYVMHRPGRSYRNPIEMSQQAPFVDAATSNDPDNFGNTFVSYYTYGAVLGLGLDLELRRRGHTLDKLMTRLWQDYGQPEIPYHIRDLQLALEKITQDSSWAAGWFDRHIYDSQLPDYADLLGDYGVEVTLRLPDTVGFYGLRVVERDSAVVVAGTVYETNPLFAAGLNRNSTIISINGQNVTSLDDWHAAVGDLQVGRDYPITFRQLGRERKGTFTATPDPSIRTTVVESVTEDRLARRRDWLKQ